jgi:hypothetical protein
LDGATTPTMTKCASRQCWRTKGIAWQLKKKVERGEFTAHPNAWT